VEHCIEVGTADSVAAFGSFPRCPLGRYYDFTYGFLFYFGTRP